MNFKLKRQVFLDSLTEEEGEKFFGIPVNEDKIKYLGQLHEIESNNKSKTSLTQTIISVPSCMQKFLIAHDCRWKHLFDMLVIILTVYSCISILYYVSFIKNINPIIYIIEGLILVSIIMSFFHKYQDRNTLEIESRYKKIALNYIFRSWFVIDIVSIVPYELFFTNYNFSLIRLIRLPKIFELINVARFDKLIDSLFSNSKNNKLQAKYKMRYFYKIFRLILISIIITYLIGCFWYLFCDMYSGDDNSFISKYGLREKNDIDKLIICCYFVLTTLSTVGYGDYLAVNNPERIFAIVIMLCGVAIFSFVMGSFTDLITSYDKKLGVSDKGRDLQNWLTLLSRFSNNKPFNSELIKKIDVHFTYFWENDRNSSISKKDPYLSFLPKSLKLKVIEFLWGDVFNKFSNFFLYNSINKDKFFKFYYDIAFCLMPRRFFPKEFVYKPDEDIEEMYLISDGSVEIGFANGNSNNEIKYCKIIKSVDCIGELYCLFNIKTKYYYTAGSEIKTFGINKYDLIKALEKHPDLYTKFKTKAYRRYHDYIKVILEKNNEEGDNTMENNNRVNGNRIPKLFRNRIENKEQEIKNVIHEIKKKFVKLDDDYSDIGRYLFEMSLECETDLIRMNSDLDEIQCNLNTILSNSANNK